ncbi:MAG: TetR/AcrR family transcriptional regulator [Nannocystaceae bacterium]
MNQRTEKKERSHQAILDSAAELLRERGIRASSVGDVMRGAGLTVGGFYGHFASKEGLFTEVLQRAAQSTWGQLLEAARGASPRDRVMSVVRRYVSRTHRDHPESGCLLPAAAGEVAREGEPYRGALADELGEFVRSLAGLLGDGALARERAVGVLAAMVGALTLSRAVAGTPLSDELLRSTRRLIERALADYE